jgi:hypothetical protein
LSHQGKDVEFTIQVNKTTGQYSVSAGELLEIKTRAAALFLGDGGQGLMAPPAAAAEAPPKPRGGKARPGR